MDPTTETIEVPRELLRELTERLARVEEVVATLEELNDTEGAERVRRAEADLRKGRKRTARTPEELREILG